MKNLLLSEKYRPKKLEECILLPRIKKIFQDNPNNNYLFWGNWGVGKTTLARILIGVYEKNAPYLEINSSYHTSIDTLRTKIDDFCSKVYITFDDDYQEEKTKWVFLDEFERTSVQYQDALKAYIEDYSKKGVRFIFTTNNIHKVSPGIKSRLIEINFDPQTRDEEMYLKKEIYKKIKENICVWESFDIQKNELVKIINQKFPDFRKILIELDRWRLSGESSVSDNKEIKSKSELYELIHNHNKNYEDIYYFILNNFGNDNMDELFRLLGRPFIEFSLENKGANIDKMFVVNSIICEHIPLLDTMADPIIVGMSAIGKIRKLI